MATGASTWFREPQTHKVASAETARKSPVVVYCSGEVNASAAAAMRPREFQSDTPSVSRSRDHVSNAKRALLFYGTGRARFQFQGRTLCVRRPGDGRRANSRRLLAQITIATGRM